MYEIFVGVCFKTRLPMGMIKKALSKFDEEKYLTFEADNDIVFILPNDSEEGCCKFIEDGFVETSKEERIKMRKNFWQRFHEDWLSLKDDLHDLLFTEGTFIL